MPGLSPSSTLSSEKNSSCCVLVAFVFFKAIALKIVIRPMYQQYIDNDQFDNIMS